MTLAGRAAAREVRPEDQTIHVGGSAALPELWPRAAFELICGRGSAAFPGRVDSIVAGVMPEGDAGPYTFSWRGHGRGGYVGPFPCMP